MTEGSTDDVPNVNGWLIASLAFSLLILLPLRAWQVEALVRPVAQSNAMITAVPAEVVLIDDQHRAFGFTSFRNDSALSNRPLRMYLGRLAPGQAETLCRTHRVKLINTFSKELSPLRQVGSRETLEATKLREIRLRAAGCA